MGTFVGKLRAARGRLRHRLAGHALELLERRDLLAGDSPVISEFMASNDNTLEDGFGNSSDWIEIRNPTAETIDLQGWHLTDDATDLSKWQFPNHPSSLLDPFEHIIVYASGRNTIDATDRAHTNFQISARGEYLALTSPDGDIATEYGSETAPFTEQETDVSYGFAGSALGSTEIQYVDATSGPNGNTRLTNPENASFVFEPSGLNIGNQGNDGQWEQRTFANGGTIFEAGADTPSDNGQALTTTVSDLAAGNYQVFAYFWSDTNNNWDLRLGLDPNAMANYNPATSAVRSLGSLADSNGFATTGFATPVLVSEGNRTLFEVSLGERTIEDGGAIKVYVDDIPNAGGRSWYDGIGLSNAKTVVRGDTPASYLIPTNDSLGLAWTQVDFDATTAGFRSGTASIGYENNPSSDTSYADYFLTTVPARTRSTFVRVPFDVEDLSMVNGLQLHLKYDDGVVVYLNGELVAERRAPNDLRYNSLATGTTSDENVLAGETLSLNRWIGSLQNGENVLAFQLLNASTTSSDYLLSPELAIATGANDSSQEVRFLDIPTPGGPNSPGFLGFVEDTKFSVDRGFYDEPFDVQITSATTDASIYYTVDGSVPSPTSPAATRYSGPIPIARTTNLRAAAFKNDYRPTNVDTQTYIFLDNVLSQDPRRDPTDPRSYPSTWQGGFTGDYEIDARVVNQWSETNPENDDATLREGLLSIPTISLTLDHDDLWNRSTGIYPNATQRGETWRRAGSIEYFDPNSDAEFQENLGISMHGAASADNNRLLKHSFRLRFSPQYDGPSRLEFPLFDNSDFANINQIILRAAFTDAFATRSVTNRYSPLDSTYLRDVWMRDAQLATGATAAQSTYVHLYINGLYWGLYSPAERPTDEQFYTAHYGGEEEDWDIVKDFNELVSGNRNAWNAMFAISRSITNSNANAKFFEIQGKRDDGMDDPNRTNYLNMDRFLDYMALHFFAGVEDWPHHNWHAGFNRENPGQGFEFLTWDQEIALDQLVRDRTNVSDSNSPGELYSDLRRSPEFRLRMADRIQALFLNDGPLSVENNQARWQQRADQIETAIIGESARWGDAREGQRITAYSAASPLPSGTGEIPRGTQTVPLMTVDHWRDSVTYVHDTFFPHAIDLFLDRMRADGMLPDTAAPVLQVNGAQQLGGVIAPNDQLTMTGDAQVYYTLDGSDPREAGGAIRGQPFTSPIALTSDTTVNARVLQGGEWSPLITAEFTLPSTEGDLNDDGSVDANDIDALFAAVNEGATESRFDLDEDGQVDDTDADYLLETILQTKRGDFDLNGQVDFADFLTLSANFGKTDELSWSDGDANGDQKVTFADFLLLSANFGFENEEASQQDESP